MKAKIQLTEENLIMKSFANLVDRDEFDEYYSIMVKSFVAYTMTTMSYFTNKDDSPITFEELLERFNQDAKNSFEASSKAMEILNQLTGGES